MRKKTTPEDQGSIVEASSSAKKRPKKKVTALSRQSEDPLWQAIDAKIGGRDGLLEAALASSNPKAAILAELCLDKAFSRSGTKDLARKADMGADEIVDLYRNKKWLEATLALHERLPEIMTGAADDAKPRMAPCPECKASGLTENGDNCWVCGGSREIRKAGDKDKLSFVGEAVGMTGKRGPAVVLNQQINNTSVNQPQSFDDLIRKASVQSKPRLIEAKKVEEE